MSEWIRKLHWKKLFLSGFWYLLISVVTQQAEVALTMRYYTDPANAGLWSKLMMPTAGPPPMIFFVLSTLFTYVAGVTLAAIFDFTKSLSKTYWTRVINFTDIIVGLSIVLSYFPMYLLFRVPLGLLTWWLVSNLVTTFFSAMAFAKIMK